MYCYLKCIVYDKLLKPQQSFRITLYKRNVAYFFQNDLHIYYFYIAKEEVIVFQLYFICYQKKKSVGFRKNAIG